MAPKRIRIDKLLVDRGIVQSRDRALRLILAGEVWVGERRIDKAGALVSSDAPVDVRGSDIPYVSRGGLKLQGALDHWQIDVRGRVAVDIGASTGGFTDCLLQRGVRRVFAIDVGYGQFAWKLRQDPRVTLFERANVRNLDPGLLPERADLAVIDVSFISLRLVLPAVLPLLAAQALLLPMVKPQFEVGRDLVGSGGVVRDAALQQATVEAIAEFAETLGLRCLGRCESPILGPKGNREFFLLLAHGGDATTRSSA
ncbi:MAG: TlyA family RNA methyltransferase [Deltaproteobacteria bacterium]|nr:TlyA family RNA methyltransferase [Deltaproteobacteria bacterium]